VGDDPNWAAPAPVRSYDVHPVPGITEDSMQAGSRSMGKNCSGTASEHRRHQMAALIEQTMPDGISTLMDPMQTTSLNPLVGSTNMKPEVLQLPQSHHSVLSSRQVGNCSVDPNPTPTGRFPSM
jgi:hypothetical protein